jgi:type IV pilus assembly protein PilW
MKLRRHSRRSRGFGIVEVLVAMVVGMLAVAAITAVFWSSEAQKRTITSGADASENGLVALSTIERDVRVAGLGLMEIACSAVNGYNANAGGTFSFNPLPVTITRDAPTAGSDRLDVIYSGSPFGNLSTQLANPVPGPGATVNVFNGQGFGAGDVILISQGTQPCLLMQASAAAARTGGWWNIPHAAGGAFPFNDPPSASFPVGGYATGAIVVNMGNIARRQYFVQNGRLMMQDLNLAVSAVSPVNPVPIADNIVTVRAQYGRDTDGDGYVDVYDVTAPAAASNVVALQIAVVARSAQLEKNAVAPSTLQLWNGGTVANGGAIALDTTAQQYRYKVYQTTVPLRNVIWGDN